MSGEASIGAFLCTCGDCITSVIDYGRVEERLRSLPEIKHVERCERLCQTECRERMANTMKDKGLDRALVVACSPRVYEPIFREVLESAGINGHMLMMTNLREQCAYIHYHAPESATEKAVDMVTSSVAGLIHMEPSEVGVKAKVIEDACVGCEICAQVCPETAITMVPNPNPDIKKLSHVDVETCVGCGVCVSSCPVGAMDMHVFSNDNMLSQVRYLAQGNGVKPEFPNIIVFECNWCGYSAGDMAGVKRLQIDPNFRTIRSLCSARVDPDWVLKALSWGADGILVLAGSPGHCSYGQGSLKAMARMKLTNMLMAQLGFDERRYQVEFVDSDQAEVFKEKVEGFINIIQELGPNPMRESL